MATRNSVKLFEIGSMQKHLWIKIKARGWKDAKRFCKRMGIKDFDINLIRVIDGKSGVLFIDELY